MTCKQTVKSLTDPSIYSGYRYVKVTVRDRAKLSIFDL